MEILSVFSPEFRAYGRVVEGYPVQGLLDALAQTPLTEGVVYVPREPMLHAVPEAQAIGEGLYGGMPFQLGWCNGHNTKLNCLEFHRDSEFNLGTEDFILLLGLQGDIADGRLDTATVKAFRCPAGVLIEVYATSLHYAPCHTDPAKGFRVMVALPMGTNTEKPDITPKTPEDKLLWARNKWLLAHPESAEAKQGAHIGLAGENINIASLL